LDMYPEICRTSRTVPFKHSKTKQLLKNKRHQPGNSPAQRTIIEHGNRYYYQSLNRYKAIGCLVANMILDFLKDNRLEEEGNEYPKFRIITERSRLTSICVSQLMGQVRHHQESTERQYALKERALELGWTPGMIRVIDSDLGISGTQMGNREGFKTLVADVSLKQVGAVFALEASGYHVPIPTGIDY